MRKFLAWLLGTTAPAPVTASAPADLKIRDDALWTGSERDPHYVDEPFRPYEPAPGVLPRNRKPARMAMDNGMMAATAWAQGGTAAIHEGYGFLGYPYLAELAQRPEYRLIVETIAREMTRKFIKITASGKSNKAEKVKKLTKAVEDYNIQAIIREMVEQDGFFGRAHLYVDTGFTEKRGELEKPLFLDPRKVPQEGLGSLQGFKTVEPIWTYPGVYNSNDPLARNFYKPEVWYVMGKTIHRDRLLTFVSREVPDVLKPAYAFGGLSLSQMMKPYVDRWVRTVRSVSDTTHQFSKTVVKTNMGAVLSGGSGADLLKRIMLFNQYRDNRGVTVLDKDTEELQDVSTPLTSLDKLQAQSQEHQASVSGIPLVILLGVTPSGLNASSDGEIKVFYARIASMQAKLKPLLTVILALLQLKVFGKIDPDLGFEFLPLWEESAKEKADTEKVEADTDAVYVETGVVSPEEVRERLANDDKSRYHGLSGPAPEPPEQDDMDGLEDDPADEA